MIFTIKMPKLSPTMEAGTIAKWHVKEGDFVEVDQLLMEVATDKATVEYNAIDSGFVRKIIVQDRGEAKVNEPLAILSEDKDQDISGFSIEEKKAEVPYEQHKEEAKPEVIEKSQEKVFASPLARVLAKQKGIDLSTVKGSGPRGRVMSRDLQNATSTSVPVSTAEAGSFIKETPSMIRKIIADKLQQAKMTIPHFYVKEEVDATNLINIRHQFKESGLAITLNDLLVKGVALALKKHPGVNSGWDAQDKTILRFQTIDISIAVDIPDGLITPIVPKADQKPLLSLSEEIKGLVTKAKANKLQPHEFQGGSFTVSNLGMFGVPEFTAIINPPQGAILAVGAALPKPRYINNQLVKRDILTLTLSVDHRVIDGALAAKFLNTLKTILESPAVILI